MKENNLIGEIFSHDDAFRKKREEWQRMVFTLPIMLQTSKNASPPIRLATLEFVKKQLESHPETNYFRWDEIDSEIAELKAKCNE